MDSWLQPHLKLPIYSKPSTVPGDALNNHNVERHQTDEDSWVTHHSASLSQTPSNSTWDHNNSLSDNISPETSAHKHWINLWFTLLNLPIKDYAFLHDLTFNDRFWAIYRTSLKRLKIPRSCSLSDDLCIYRHTQFTTSFPPTAILTPNGTEIKTLGERGEIKTWRRTERTCFAPQCVVGINLHRQFIIQRQQAFQHLPKHQLTSIKHNTRTGEQMNNQIRPETRVIKCHMWGKIGFGEVILQWLRI